MRTILLASLTLGLAACGEVSTSIDPDGATPDDAASHDAAPALDCHDPGVRDALFVVSYSGPEVEIFDCFSELADGATGGNRVLAGQATGLTASWYQGVAVDAASNELYVFDSAAHAILVWDDADTVDGDVAPDRLITSTAFTYGGAMALDPTRDRLYVIQDTAILAFDGASALGAAATPAATRTIEDNLQLLEIDPAADRLYVTGINQVLVFDAASTLSGTAMAAPNRSFALTETRGVSIDAARDVLYVGARVAGGAVHAIEGAATASGAVTPARTIVGSTAVPMNQVEQTQVEDDQLFVYNDGASQVWVYDPASAATGAATPVKTVHFGQNAGSVAGGVYVP